MLTIILPSWKIKFKRPQRPEGNIVLLSKCWNLRQIIFITNKNYANVKIFYVFYRKSDFGGIRGLACLSVSLFEDI